MPGNAPATGRASRHAAYVAAILASMLVAGVAIATPPIPPVQLVFEGREALKLRDGRLELPISTNAREAARDIVVTVHLRPVLPDKPDQEQPRLQRVQEVKLREARGRQKVRVALERLVPGEYLVQVRVEGRTGEDDGFSDVLLLYVTIDRDGNARVERPEARAQRVEAARWQAFRADLEKHPDHPRVRLLRGDTYPMGDAKVVEHDVPAGERLEVRPSDEPDDTAKYYRDGTKDAWQPEDPITVRGRVTFTDVDGSVKPLVNVGVRLWDEDTFGDELLGTVATGWDGRWSFSVNNDDGWFQDGRDIYYTFTLANSRVGLTRCGGDYRWQSAVHEDSNDGIVIDFGSETAGSDTNALIVWDRLNLSWAQASGAGGRDPGKIDACFPAGATNYTTTVNVAAADFDGDGVSHEYGHALMDNAYDDDVSPGGAHGFGDCSQDTGLAWSEGWATGFMLNAFPDGRYNWHFGDVGRAIENFSSSCGTRVGEKNEGWVAASILDFTDAANDTNGGSVSRGRTGYDDGNSGNRISLASIFRDTMWGGTSFDALDFWYDLVGNIASAQRNPGQEIMYYNYMSVLAPDACVATKAATARLPDADAVLSDLRRFRDLVLKRDDRGRELANRYYRNSPEMASLLLADDRATADALVVIRHFAVFGATVGTHRRYLEAFESNSRVVPDDVDAAVGRLFDFFAQRGGATLRGDVDYARKEYERVRKLTLPELQKQMEKADAGAAKKVRMQPRAFSPESRRALETPGVRALREQGLPKPPDR